MDTSCAVILAAGDGKRMKSKSPKVLCEVLFKPMISWVADAVRGAGIESCCVVVSPHGEGEISPILPKGFTTALQAERLGTGHAAFMAADFIRRGGFSDVLVLYGDAPFFSSEDIARGLEVHKAQNNHVTAYSALLDNPYGYGRIVQQDSTLRIIEEKDADPATKQIKQINAGTYWFNAAFLLEFFERMDCSNAQGEYYLTDSVGYASQTGKDAGIFAVEASHVHGANDRAGLSLLNDIARRKIISGHLEAGVNIPFADGIIIGPDVQIGADTTILLGSILRGKTTIGEDCEIGPDTMLTNARIGAGCLIRSSQIEKSCVEDNARIGPWCNIRPDCAVGSKARIGNFVELKNSNIGAGTSVAHLTYIGDSDVGAGCNFGCGVVTANYDGKDKHRTVVGDHCFIGCNCNLVPPVKMGNRVYAATGTTVTEDVPDGSLVIGRVRQEVKKGWADKRGLFTKK